MSIEARKVQLTETSLAELRRTQPHRIWRPKMTEAGPVPPGQKLLVCVLAVADTLNEDHHGILASAIEQVPGVQKALPLIYGTAPTADKIPEGHQLVVRVEGRIAIRQLPQP